MNAMVPIQSSNAELYRASTDAAELCKGIVLASAMAIQGRKYVKVEGWQAIAIAHGCTGSAREVERVDGGVRAIGEVRRMSDGAVIAEAEGFVGEDEPTWYGGTVESYGKVKTLPKRPEYAIRAMAQTRAISRACRSAFAHVVVMMNAGLSTTPAEEVPDGGYEDREAPRNVTPERQPKESPAVGAAKLAIKLCKDVPALKKWKAENAGQLSKFASDDADEIVRAMNARLAELKEAAAAPEPAPARDDFGIGDDDIPEFR